MGLLSKFWRSDIVFLITGNADMIYNIRNRNERTTGTENFPEICRIVREQNSQKNCEPYAKIVKVGKSGEPSTMCKQLINFITCGCESSAPFFVNYKARREPTP
jgi:hypothetical protein